MRKNTLIKLLAVLAMCLVIGVALIACGDEPAEVPANDEAKVIISVAFDSENNLVVTYADNTTYKVALPTEAECEHQNDVYWPLAEHTATANGTYLRVCHDCQDAWIVYDKRHQIIEKEITVPATCETDGYTTNEYCEVCGYTANVIAEFEKIGHEYVRVNEIPSICVTGGTYHTECINCGIAGKDEVIPAAEDEGIDGQHTVTAWTKSDADPLVIVGTCDVCGDHVEYTVPAFLVNGAANKVDYDVVHGERTNCREAVYGTFTLKAAKNIVYTNVEVIPAGKAHQLKNSEGVLVDVYTAGVTYLDANGDEQYYTYSIEDFKGIKSFADKPVDSCQYKRAYYVCEFEDCGAVVDVFAYTKHDFKVVDSKAATCTENGWEKYACSVCNAAPEKDAVVTIEAKGHKYVYAADKFADLTKDDTGYYYTVTCEACDYNKNEYVTDFNETTKDATCTEKGEIVRTWKDHTGKACSDTEYFAANGHHLNGQKMEASETNTVYAWTEGCGIHAFDHEGKDINATRPIIAYFTCDDCGGKVDVWAQVNSEGNTFVPVVPVTSNEDND